jgi:catalase
MSESFHYGFVKRSDGKILSKTGDKEWRDSWLKEYFLQNLKELTKNKYGVCWDFVEFQREWFKNNNYEFETFFMAVIKKEGSGLPTHTFLVYKFKNKWYWFEFSWYDQRGIHKYNDLNSLWKDLNNKHIKSIVGEGALFDDITNHKIYEYKDIVFGTDPITFVSKIIKDINKVIIE